MTTSADSATRQYEVRTQGGQIIASITAFDMLLRDYGVLAFVSSRGTIIAVHHLAPGHTVKMRMDS